MSVEGTLYNIQHFSIHDGPGIRTTVFMKGCPLTCWWCHNPESRSHAIRKNGNGTIGQRYTPYDLITILLKDEVFYDQSGGGVTFSGGEPLEQPEFLYEMLLLCCEHGIHSAVDTCGSAPREIFERIAPVPDLFLYDLKLMDPIQLKKYTSADASVVLGNLEYLLRKGSRVTIRIPLIPRITSDRENLRQIIRFLEKFAPMPEINLLPYHRTAEGKYEKLNMENKMKGAPQITDLEVKTSYEIFKSSGFPVTLG